MIFSRCFTWEILQIMEVIGFLIKSRFIICSAKQFDCVDTPISEQRLLWMGPATSNFGQSGLCTDLEGTLSIPHFLHCVRNAASKNWPLSGWGDRRLCILLRSESSNSYWNLVPLGKFSLCVFHLLSLCPHSSRKTKTSWNAYFLSLCRLSHLEIYRKDTSEHSEEPGSVRLSKRLCAVELGAKE